MLRRATGTTGRFILCFLAVLRGPCLWAPGRGVPGFRGGLRPVAVSLDDEPVHLTA